MQSGIYVPLFGEYSDPAVVVDLAQVAEAAGWDGCFVSDHVYINDGSPVGDAFVALAGIAAVTDRIRLGPLVTPVARRRPWVLARQATSVDHLSRGRLIFGAGLGVDEWQQAAAAFAESARQEEDRQELVDESIALLRGFWSGNPVRLHGHWHQVDTQPFLPVPLQRPSIPLWIAARWPPHHSYRRAATADGIYPIFTEAISSRFHPRPAQVSQVRAEVRRQGAPRDHDLVLRGSLGPPYSAEALEHLGSLEEAGMTWWLESVGRDEPAAVARARVGEGPPRLD